MFRGFLFDFDGTLGKTMEDHFNAWRDTLKDYQIDINENDYYPLEGMSMELIARKLCKENTLKNDDINSIVSKKKLKFISKNNFKFYPGVEEIIEKLLKSKNKIGIVTSSHSDQLEQVVPRDFLRKFHCIVYGNEVSKGKPEPEPYIKGIERLNLSSEECIAIENAPLGISSAKSAGLYCIGVCSTVKPEYLTNADELVNEFQCIIELRVIKNSINKSFL